MLLLLLFFVLVVLPAALVFAPLLLTLWRWRHVPGPTPLPLLGNLHEVATLSLHGFMDKVFREHGDARKICKIFMGPEMFLFVADPAAGRALHARLTTRYVGAVISGPGDQEDLAMTAGLLAASGDLWKTLRLAWQPAFTTGSLQGYAALMDSSARKLAALMEAAADEGRVVDIYRELGNMTLDVVGTTALGAEPPNAAAQQLVEAAQVIFSSSTASSGSVYLALTTLLPQLHVLWQLMARWLPDASLKRLSQARALLRRLSQELIDTWAARGASAGNVADADADAAAAPGAMARKGARAVAPGSFLGLLLEASHRGTGEKLTDRVVAAQTSTFILAGYETTANALAFTIYCLAANPRAQAALLAELDALGGTLDSPDALADAQLPYTEAVLSEALRLYPPGIATSRTVDKPGGITVPSGLHIPQGIRILMCVYMYQKDPDFWPRAKEFLPERWLEGSREALGPSVADAYTPFGAGSRMCIGYRFALQEAKIALVRLYQRVTFELEPGQVPLKLADSLTLAPKNGVIVRPVRRLRPAVPSA